MKNNFLIALISSLVATLFFGIITYLQNSSFDYLQLVVFFLTYLIAFYIALNYFKQK